MNQLLYELLIRYEFFKARNYQKIIFDICIDCKNKLDYSNQLFWVIHQGKRELHLVCENCFTKKNYVGVIANYF